MDRPPALSKSRTIKFHKLFKTVPDNEYPIDYFSCAFIGDILLQGNLYVSQNWFCFYSRIRGRGRLLEIPMDSVISITREKTAIIFPNAIGLQTKKAKFAFGSFISRDNTYKFLVSIWKKSQEAKTSEEMDMTVTGDNIQAEKERSSTLVREDTFESAVSNGNQDATISNQSHSNSKSDTSDNSDSSGCVESGSLGNSELDDAQRSKTDSTAKPMHSKIRKKHTGTRDKKVSHVRKKASEGKRLQFPYSVIHCIDKEKTLEALRNSASKLQKIPRTSLLLAICTVLVLFLMLSSVGLTYKILNLEAQISSQRVWTETDQKLSMEKTYVDIMGLQSVMRESTAEHMQTMLKANLKILQEINSSLQDLRRTNDRLRPENVCQSAEDC